MTQEPSAMLMFANLGETHPAILEGNRLALERQKAFRAERLPPAERRAAHNKLKHQFPFHGFVGCPVGPLTPIMFSANDDVVAWNYFWMGDYEKDILDLWYEVTSKTKVALDIGAYTGLFSLVAAMNGNEVHAFEIVPRTVERAKINVLANGLEKKIQLHPFGLSNEDSVIDLHMPRGQDFLGTGNSIDMKTNKPLADKTLAYVRSFQTFAKEVELGSFGALKIDVEGHEFEVLSTMKPLLEKHRPTMIIEISGRNKPAVRGLLKELGYRVESLKGMNHVAYP